MAPIETMSSIQQWALSKRPRAVELGVDPCDGSSFSWSGIELVVDLSNTSLADVENVGTIHGALIVDDDIHPSNDPTDATSEPRCTQGCSSPPHYDTEVLKDTLLRNDENAEKECDKQPPNDLEECGVEDDPDRNYTHYTWPDWGERLPPEEDADDVNVEYAFEVEKIQSSKKVVIFSDAVTFVKPGSLQEKRGTGSLCNAGCLDDGLDQGTDQVTSSNEGNLSNLSHLWVSSKEKEAAYHLLELSNELNCGHSNSNDFKSSAVSGSGKGVSYDPSYDLEKLSELLEKNVCYYFRAEHP